MKNKIIALALTALAGAGCLYAQTDARLLGVVVDQKGNPVVGAKVAIAGSRSLEANVSTDKDGHFSIYTAGAPTIVVKASNGSEKTVDVSAATAGTPIEVVMSSNNQAVNYGYGPEQTLAESTGAVSIVQADRIDNRSSYTFGNSMYGNAVGLTTMQSTGTLWDQIPSMHIRGMKSLNGNVGILVVVDGLERDDAYQVLNYLTPEEVESVSVLRDAAAVALYGYKGVNGVLNIVTKRGKYNTREISFSYDHGFITQNRRPEMADAYTYAKAYNEALTNDGRSARYSQQELNAYKTGQYPYYYPNVDWWDETLRDRGNTDIATISFRGGGSKLRYFTMLNLHNGRGFYKNTNHPDGYSTQEKYSKANLRSNLDITLTPTTLLKVNLMGMLEEFSRPGLNSDNLYTKLYTTPANAFPIKNENGVYGGSATWDGWYNLVALAQGRGYSKGHSLGMWADATLKQDLSALTPGLSASIRIGYDNLASYWEDHTRTFKYESPTVVGWENGAPVLGDPYTGGSDSELSGSSKLDWQYRSFNFVANVDWTRQFGDHKVSTMLMYKYKYNSNANVNSTFYYVDWSWYTHYGYKDRYFADLALVTSASNRLDHSGKWHVSPTLGLAWNITGEEFMKDLAWIDFLKLRGSVGILNTDNIPYNGYWYQSMGGGGGYPINDNYGYGSSWAETTMAATDGTTEKAYKYNVGVDATLFGGLNLQADAWFEHRKDIWVSSTYGNSAVLGASSSYANAGVVDSKGLEFGASYTKRLGEFRLNVGGTYTISKNTIKEQMEEPRLYDYLRRTGQSVGQIFALQAVGFFYDQNDIDASPYQTFGDVKPGDIKYKDQNGDNVIDSNDFVAMGYNSSVPEIYYSLNLGLEWRGIGFNVDFQGVDHYSVWTTLTGLYRPMVNGATLSNYYYENRWTPENTAAKYPRLTTESNDNNNQSSSVWLKNGAFLKLRNAEVYYNFPKELISQIGMSRAKLYVRGIDLFCWDHLDKKIDPEALNGIPTNRSINIGLQVGF